MHGDVYVIQDQNTGKFLLQTRSGTPIFGELERARTFITMAAVSNQVTRIKGEFDIRYRRLRLTLEGSL